MARFLRINETHTINLEDVSRFLFCGDGTAMIFFTGLEEMYLGEEGDNSKIGLTQAWLSIDNPRDTEKLKKWLDNHCYGDTNETK